MYCKYLHESITLSIAKTKKLLRETAVSDYVTEILKKPDLYGEFINRKKDTVFTVDPIGCLDRDDALSISYSKMNGIYEYKISVYIANVWVWLELFDLWNDIGNRVSTIYFPIMKRPMLPTAIGEQLCSLDADHDRFGFVMDFIVVEHIEKGIIKMLGVPTLKQCILRVKHNYDYEEDNLLNDPNYIRLMSLTQRLDSNVKDSHEVIAYWMMQMNCSCAQIMKEKKIGIYRTVHSKNPNCEVQTGVPMFVRILEQQLSGMYKMFKIDEKLNHEVLGFSEYIHFTSPIRRMVDLLNQIKWIIHIVQPKNIRAEVDNFYQGQTNNLDVLNAKMKKIRRIQSDCDILYKITNDEHLIQKTFEGIVVSIETNVCNIYIEELQWLSHVKTSVEFKKYDKIKCKLYIFEKEEQMKKRIRIQII